jgi:osmoprotectant transport system permease protein
VEPRVKTFLDAFRFMGDHLGLLATKTVEHLELSGAALCIALVLALPLGLWLGHRHRGLFVALTASSLGRALPSLVLIAVGLTLFPFIPFFWNNALALVVLAVPSILANSYFGIAGVDRDVVEAARGMGLTERQVLLRVELPLGLPLVVAGIRIAAIFVIATATIAAVAGGGGLGEIIVDQASYGLDGVVAASLWVTGLAFLSASVLGLLRRALPRGPAPTT